MEIIPKWKPTVAICHAEGCVTNAIISAELALKIFRQVSEELTGKGEGPQVEEPGCNRVEGVPTDPELCQTCAFRQGCELRIDKKELKPEEGVSLIEGHKEDIIEKLEADRTCPNGRPYTIDCRDMKWHEGLCHVKTDPKPCDTTTTRATMDQILRDDAMQIGVHPSPCPRGPECICGGKGGPENKVLVVRSSTEEVKVEAPKKKRKGIRHRNRNPVKDEAIDLLEKGKKPKEVLEILKGKYDKPPALNLIHQWNHERKKAKESTEPVQAVGPKKFGNVHSKKREFNEAMSAGCDTREKISEYLAKKGYDVDPAGVSNFIYHNMRGEIDETMDSSSQGGKKRYYPLGGAPDQGPKEPQERGPRKPGPKKEETKDDTAIFPDENKATLDKYAHLKIVERSNRDLLIIGGNVLCPITNMALPADGCPGSPCGKYIATIKTDDTQEPHVRCLKAGA